MGEKGKGGTGGRVFSLPILFLICLGLGCSDILQGQPTPEGSSENRAIQAQDNYYAVAAPEEDQAWVVGYHGKILHTADGGKSWNIQKSGTRSPLFSVSFVDRRHGLVTGRGGIILRTLDGGKVWQAINPSPTTLSPLSVTHADADNVWAVGEGGLILHSNDGGITWEDHSLATWGDKTQIDIYGTDVILNRVLFTDPQNGWIVGEFGKIFRTRDGGKSWTWQSNVTGVNRDWIYLYDIGFREPQQGWIVGAGGILLATQDGGESWRTMESENHSTLYSLAFGRKGALAVGGQGMILQLGPDNEGNWEPVQGLVLHNWLRSLTISERGRGWIVGGKGTILKVEEEDGRGQLKLTRITEVGNQGSETR